MYNILYNGVQEKSNKQTGDFWHLTLEKFATPAGPSSVHPESKI